MKKIEFKQNNTDQNKTKKVWIKLTVIKNVVELTPFPPLTTPFPLPFSLSFALHGVLFHVIKTLLAREADTDWDSLDEVEEGTPFGLIKFKRKKED